MNQWQPTSVFPASRCSTSLASRCSIAVLSCTLLVGWAGLSGCTRQSGGGKASVPELLVPASDDIIAYVAIPSLDAALRGVADFLQRVAPPGAPPQTSAALKAQLGGMLGDPELAAIDASRPIVVAVFKPSQPGPIPPIVALLPAKDAAKLATLVAPMGLVAKAEAGLVAVAQTSQALELALKVQPLHARISSTPLAATARLHAATEALLTAYGPLLEIGLGQMTKTLAVLPGTGASAASILKLEARALLALLAQTNAFELDLEVGRDSIGVNAVVKARQESELARLFERSALREAPTRSFLENPGGVVASLSVDPVGTAALYQKVFDAIAADAEIKDFVTPELQEVFMSMQDSTDGTFVFSMGASASGLAFAYDLGITSEEKLLSMVESSLKLLAPDSGLGKFYRDMGLELTTGLERKVREHSGVGVHRVTMKSAPTADANPELQASAKQLQAFLGQSVEIAVVDQRALASSSPVDLERMLAAAQAKKAGNALALKAREVFGGGRQGYVDYDLGALMQVVAASMPEGDVKAGFSRMFSGLAGTPPMVAAFTCEGPRGLFQLRLPVEMIVKMREAAEAPR